MLSTKDCISRQLDAARKRQAALRDVFYIKEIAIFAANMAATWPTHPKLEKPPKEARAGAALHAADRHHWVRRCLQLEMLLLP